MAGIRPEGLQKLTVQEATNASLKRVIKVQPTITLDDNDDNHVAFNWTEIPNASLGKGTAVKLNSIFILNGNDIKDVVELVFCKGSDDDGTAPTAAQQLGAGSAVVDITAAEAQAVEICGHVNIVDGDYSEGDLLTARIGQKTDIGLIMSPKPNATSLYVGGIWRYEPADASAYSTGVLDIYFGFEG